MLSPKQNELNNADTGAQELNPSAQLCLRDLMTLWFEFERNLGRVNVIRRLLNRQFDTQDYQQLLLHLRQQVIEGSRWITRAASSFDREYSDIRSLVIGHAQDEHRDYEMIELDYVAVGGKKEKIHEQTRNVGSDALHGFLMYRASLNNPIDLIGAMWIIEGLGQKMAEDWSERIGELIDSDVPVTRFMKYHAENDGDHMQKLYEILDRVCQSKADASRICQTAKVVGRLYCLQLEEIDAR